MSVLLNGLWLLLGFGVFMALIWSVYAVNRAAARRFGYEPFSLPNAALMLVANLLLLSALTPAAQAPSGDVALRTQVMLGAAAVLALWLFVIIARRSNGWYALYAVALMSVGAIAVLPSLVFMRFAVAPAETSGEGSRRQAQPARDPTQDATRVPPKGMDGPRG
ncbi:MAG: hypothetical protein LJE69_17785 [Thiohalocapsa sp.]|jgi:hypothetical protein|uniref:hypothetical protein n=1 Tax=Thiohalocapsa sp. TaxID=2497641 RepID=UPI0025E9322E|nr:hypothetical protein [Thiohalocapsa sp.]MCG6943086.1 hypothetical protein [Thiohalocapsa sp.]